MITQVAMGWARFWLCTLFVCFLVLSVTRPKLPLAHIDSGSANDATYGVYSPKAVKKLTYLKCYEYSTLYLVQNILPFCAIEVLDSKQVLNT